MEKELLLELAKDRFMKKNQITDLEYNLPIKEFLMLAYVKCDPNTYGKAVMKKIHKDHSRHLYSVSDKANIGDLVMVYPKHTMGSGGDFYISNGKGKCIELDIMNDVKKTFIEGKTSYLGKKNLYTIRHVRDYQEFDHYLFCLVDCYNNFKPEFILVEKRFICNGEYVNLSIMNGNKEGNEGNKNVSKGFTFEREGRLHNIFRYYNKLESTDYHSVEKFLEKEKNRLKTEFWDWDNHLSKIKGINRIINCEEEYNEVYHSLTHNIPLYYPFNKSFV
jgi:hypothetical protein